MKIRNVLAGLVFSVFAASSLASSGLAGQPAPDFALKSSSGENPRRRGHDQLLGYVVRSLQAGDAAAR